MHRVSFKQKIQSGQSLVELLMAIGLAAILMPAFLVGFSATRGGRAQQDQRIQAISYMRQTEEAIRIIRDNGWNTLTPSGNGIYHPVQSGSTWVLQSGTESPISGTTLTRSVDVEDALRDPVTHQISLSGTDDPSTKAITVTISWQQPIANSSITQVMYVTRHENKSFLDTTVANFTAGTNNGTAVTDIYDGEVELGGSGSSDWCNPNGPGIVKYNLTGNGTWTAISAVAPSGATSGHAYTTFGFNQSGNPLDSVNITDANPPALTAGSSFTADNIKTYGLYADPTSSYVYITSNSSKYQVDVVNATNFSAHAATFASSGGEAGYSVYVASINGTKTGFLTAADTTHSIYKLYSFTVGSAPSGVLTQNGNPVTLAGVGNRVVVVGNYAYVATSSTTSQLQIFNVNNPSVMSLMNFTNGFSVGSLQGATPQGATDLAVDSTGKYAFLSTGYVDSSHPDIFVIDVSNPSAPVVVGSANTYQNGVSMSPNGIIPVSGNHIIVVGTGGQEYQVFYFYPVVKYCGGLTLSSSATKITAVAGVSENDGDNFAYILTDDSSGWFQIVPGGQGGGSGTGGAGTFISEGIPVPSLTANATFNNFFPIADVPSPTTIAYQVGVAPTCSSPFTFIGPDGTSNTTFATASAIPLTGASGYQNPGECFKYKVMMNANGSNALTPILYQVTVNYSP